ncbi:transcriptional regulator, AraC family [Flavobacterium frigoris PS1]|jgi:YesN/AraC family two-component response regulator|uniref:Transcriptional regulator, AraC family n=3 Tax=Flavobacterium TaxID=237 RepID=H7FWN4_FLAFP|nr:transcriptional regulator, AraC family [Flavobacterium frigoris PS1]
MVKSELEKLGLTPLSIEIGEILIREDCINSVREQLIINLNSLGLAIIDDRKSQTIEKIKIIILDLVHHSEVVLKINLSNHISDQLNQNYHYLSNLFTEANEMTIEHYFIAQKIERAKELLIYNEHSLSEIAYQLNYSSVAHLSKQFKKVTGLTATSFKKIKRPKV